MRAGTAGRRPTAQMRSTPPSEAPDSPRRASHHRDASTSLSVPPHGQSFARQIDLGASVMTTETARRRQLPTVPSVKPRRLRMSRRFLHNDQQPTPTQRITNSTMTRGTSYEHISRPLSAGGSPAGCSSLVSVEPADAAQHSRGHVEGPPPLRVVARASLGRS
jgi:hypothetical protein